MNRVASRYRVWSSVLLCPGKFHLSVVSRSVLYSTGEMWTNRSKSNERLQSWWREWSMCNTVRWVSVFECLVWKTLGGFIHVYQYFEASPRVLCSVLGPLVQERHVGPGVWPGKGSETGEGSGAQALMKSCWGNRNCLVGEEEAQGRPYHFLQLPERRLWWGTKLAFSPV